MKKILLILSLLLVTTNVYAEWIFVAENPTGKTYVLSDSIKPDGDMVSYWEIIDFKSLRKAGNYQYRSVIMKNEANCNTEQINKLSLAAYTDNMGQGTVIHNTEYKQKDFKLIIPTSTEYVTYKFVCNKK
jgi:hypothetical protein